MSDVLIFGLSGQVGEAMLPLLNQGMYRVTAVSRQVQINEKNIVWYQADFLSFMAMQKHYDVIISLGPLDAFSAWMISTDVRANKIIALSSTSIVTKINSSDEAEQALAESLQKSEKTLTLFAKQMCANLILLRPTLMYGVGRDQNLSRWLNLAKRYKYMVLPKHACGLRQPVHVADVAMAVMIALSRVDIRSMVLDLPGGETLAFDQMLLRSLHAHVPDAKVLRIPNFLFRAMLELMPLLGLGRGVGSGFFARLQQDWVFDCRPAEQALGYQPRAFSP
jgi:nucleoside-diphosphate-sugar epimerase